MAKANSLHVAPREHGWVVRSSGSVRATSRHRTQEEAIEIGRALASKRGTELYVFGSDGRIREMRSFKVGAVPPKG